MIRNYVLVAFRNLTRNKFFSAVNIFGLAIAMSICMAIMMLVADQLMYDRYNTNRERIYRITSTMIGKDGLEYGNEYATTSLPVRNELLENYTGVEKAIRIVRGFGNGWIEFENQDVNVPLAGFYADAETLDFFQYELEHGDPRTALVEPYSVVITKKAAKKLFKQENPVGETIKVGELGIYKVTGVLKETENKSHIVFEALASIATLQSKKVANVVSDVDNWDNFTAGWVYIMLQKNKTESEVQTYYDKIYKKYYAGITNPDKTKVKFHSQSLMSISPGALLNNAIGPFLPWLFVYFFAGLAAIVMLTSCFNFTNLSIAKSLSRAREIGVRKVTGASRIQIFRQFMVESIILSLLSLVVALGLLLVFKPMMLQLSVARTLKWDLEANYVVYAVFVVFAIVVGILAGLFPAVVLSGFQPVKVLKGMSNVKLFSKIGLRKSLLVVQFTFSLIFILSVIIVFNQLNYFLKADHGFSTENKINVRLNSTLPGALKTALEKYACVDNVSAVSHIPAAGTTYGGGFKKNADDKEWTNLNYFSVDEDYLQNIDVSLIAGKHFTKEAGESNKNFIVINEKAVKAFSFSSPADALGQEVIFQNDSSRKQIIGVVKDYTHQLLIEKMDPMALMYDPTQFKILQVKYVGDYETTAKAIETAWASVNPGLKVDYKDFGYELRWFYDMIFGDLVNILSVIAFLAIVISCFGLLGMAIYTTETRMKEISIRKILGSTDRSLIILLSKGFITLLLIAIIIGVPIAYVINNLWLQNIAYHIEISPGIILSGIFVLIVFGAVTIGSQTIRAAFTNPVDNLKRE